VRSGLAQDFCLGLNIRLQVAGASHEAASQARGVSHDMTLQVAGASHETASQARGVSHDTTLQVAGASHEAASKARDVSHDTTLQVAAASQARGYLTIRLFKLRAFLTRLLLLTRQLLK